MKPRIDTPAAARERGRVDGIHHVEVVLAEQGPSAVTADGWDEAAINAGAARWAGIPPALEEAYYNAYADAAREHAQQVLEEAAHDN